MASWFSDIIDGVGSAIDFGQDFLDTELGENLFNLGLGYLAKDEFATKTPQVGYQGKIPEYTAVRDRVPMPAPVAGQVPRRPGESGRRYFSDTIFAQTPEDKVPLTLEQAKTLSQDYAQELSTNPIATQDEVLSKRFLDPNAPVPVDANTRTDTNDTGSQTPVTIDPVITMAAGGIASAHKGYYLGGKTDGMADEVPATIDGTQEARLSDGEFVIPADVVSHLGNGNSDAGAEQLHGMMDGIRKARTGNSEQGKQIDPNKFMPKMAQGGIAQAYNNGGPVQKFNTGSQDPVTTDPVTTTGGTGTGGTGTGGTGTGGTGTGGTGTGGTGGATDGIFDTLIEEGGADAGFESSLSSWAGDYVTDMLGRGAALADTGYEDYTGPLSAGTSDLQEQAFTTAGELDADTANMGIASFGADQAKDYMNPYLMASLNPQLDEARRQAEIDRVAAAGRLTRAGGFGGSRQAIMESEGLRNLQTNLAGITGKGYETAYNVARDQYNKEQAARNKYGFDVMAQQQGLGAVDRAIESEGMAADYAQFREERDYPYKQVQYMQSLLQGLPLEAQSNYYTGPSSAGELAKGTAGVEDLLKLLGINT